MGIPIINQPQVGILALGAIRKIPAVVETSEGDFLVFVIEFLCRILMVIAL